MMDQRNIPALSKSSDIAQKISSCTEEQIKQVLRYVIALIGVPAESLPVKESKVLMLNYIREKWGNAELTEIKEAFEAAVNNDYRDSDGKPILNLYGKPFNIAFIRSVVLAHRSKKAAPQPNNLAPNINQQAAMIYDILPAETKSKLKSIGKEKSSFERFKPREKSANERLMDAWIAAFDRLRRSQDSFKTVNVGGVGMTIDDYLNYRFEKYLKKQ